MRRLSILVGAALIAASILVIDTQGCLRGRLYEEAGHKRSYERLSQPGSQVCRLHG